MTPRSLHPWAKPSAMDTGLADYPDKGCHVSPSCLNCPRDVCIEDEPPTHAPAVAATARKLRAEGVPVAVVADYLGVTVRTVQRYGRKGK